MKRQTIPVNYLRSLCWVKDGLVDYANAGLKYYLSGGTKQLYHITYGFGDRAICSDDGQYAFLYQNLGTKGLLLKHGELIREINRSYYQADVYEYPAAFLTYLGRTYLIHCPLSYCRLDIEDVESGEIITAGQDREPMDCFHSRLELSSDGKYLLSKGWYWHPWDCINLFNVKECFNDPSQLDRGGLEPPVSTEICTANFIDNHRVLIGTSGEEALNDEIAEVVPPKNVAVWNILENTIVAPTKVMAEFGNLFAIDDQYFWDTYQFPKIIDRHTGIVVDQLASLPTSKQNSSIVHHIDPLIAIAFDKKTRQIAFVNGNNIEILSPEW